MRTVASAIFLVTVSTGAVLAAGPAVVSPRPDIVGTAVAQQVKAGGAARVMVFLGAGPVEGLRGDALKARVAEVQERVLSALAPDDFVPVRRFAAIPAFAGTVTAAGLSRLSGLPDVVRIDLDEGGGGNLAQARPLVRADLVQSLGFTGNGVTVAILDSGADTDHPDLASSLDGQACFCSGGVGGCCPGGGTTKFGPGAAEDNHGHGSNVSGIVTSDGVVSSIGIAPDAKFVAIKVLDATNSFCCSSDVVAGLDWIIANRPDVDIVNMSLGTAALFTGDCDNSTAFTMAYANAINTLRNNNVATFVSTGNNGSGTQMQAPACVANAISVAAVWDSNVGPVTVLGCTDATTAADQITCFSNTNAQTNLLAPGAPMTSDYLGGGLSTFYGTSQASPTAAGCAADLRQAYPGLSPATIESALVSTGVSILNPKNGLTFRRIDCLAAFDSLKCVDADGDGYSPSPIVTCLHPDIDCDDTDPTSYPGAAELCDNHDNDCDTQVDEELGWTRCGLGACGQEVQNCVGGVPQTCTIGAPTAAETCNGLDDDCDGRIDEDLVQACNGGCAQGVQRCAFGEWSACTGAPCCECNVGGSGGYADICAAAAGGCQVICVEPGTYPAPTCNFGQAIATQGSAVTHLVGDFQSANWRRLQGFDVQGTVRDVCRGDLFDNTVSGQTVINYACGDLNRYFVISNRFAGGLTTWGAAVVLDNEIAGSGLDGGGRGARLVSGNAVTSTDQCIFFTGSTFGGANQIDDNHLSACVTGVLLQTGAQQVGVTGNWIEATQTGAEVANFYGLPTTVVSNRILGFSDHGVLYSGNSQFVGQIVGNLVDSNSASVPPGPGPIGIEIRGSAAVQENTIVRNGIGVAASPDPNSPAPARLDLDSNIVARNSATGVSATGLTVHARSNDVTGNGVNWSGVPDPTGTDGNLSLDPNFIDPVAGDFTLHINSICIDRGLSTARPLDLAGFPRRIDGDLDGLLEQDIGAFETLPEVDGLTVSDPDTLVWYPSPYANRYDVYRGLLSEIRAAHLLVTHRRACEVIYPYSWNIVLDAPPIGDGYIYLVAPRAAAQGSLGRDSNGVERPITEPCP